MGLFGLIEWIDTFLHLTQEVDLLVSSVDFDSSVGSNILRLFLGSGSSLGSISWLHLLCSSLGFITSISFRDSV